MVGISLFSWLMLACCSSTFLCSLMNSVEQHRVDRVVAYAEGFSFLVAYNQVWVYLGHLLGN